VSAPYRPGASPAGGDDRTVVSYGQFCPLCGGAHGIRLVRKLWVDPPGTSTQMSEAVARSGGRPLPPREPSPSAGSLENLGFSAPWSLEISQHVGASGRATKDSPVPVFLAPKGRPREDR
jgi:hypothetical protein